MADLERQIPREELRRMASELLDALGLEEVERAEEERQVIRRAIDGYRKRKAEQKGQNVV